MFNKRLYVTHTGTFEALNLAFIIGGNFPCTIKGLPAANHHAA
jgi:hypothetical protein